MNYLVTNDKFFANGFWELLKCHLSLNVVDPDEFIYLRKNDSLDVNSIVFVELGSTADTLHLLSLLDMDKCKVKTIIIGDKLYGPFFGHYWQCQYISKHSNHLEFIKLIELLNRGVLPSIQTFTPRQKTVLTEILRGTSSQQICMKLGITEKTISAHKIRALKRIGLKNINSLGGILRHSDY